MTYIKLQFFTKVVDYRDIQVEGSHRCDVCDVGLIIPHVQTKRKKNLRNCDNDNKKLSVVANLI